MDANPTVVVNDAIHMAKDELSSTGSKIAVTLVEQLAKDPHYAEIEITVKCKIMRPQGQGADTVAQAEKIETWFVYGSRVPMNLRR